MAGTSASLETVLKPIRSQVHEGARKLKAAAGLGHPLVVVLTNPHRAPVILGNRELVWAIEGDAILRVPVKPTAAAPMHTVGRNGELAREHGHVTAVVLLRTPLGDDRPSVEAFIPNNGEAVQLPESFFRGPRDAVLEYSYDEQAYVLVHPSAEG